MNTPNSNFAGIYYVYQGNAIVDGGTNGQNTPWNATVLAEAGGTGCTRIGGNVENRLTDITSFLPGFVLVAGSDLTWRPTSLQGPASSRLRIRSTSAPHRHITGFVVAGGPVPEHDQPFANPGRHDQLRQHAGGSTAEHSEDYAVDRVHGLMQNVL
jgi:hypothetical protein